MNATPFSNRHARNQRLRFLHKIHTAWRLFFSCRSSVYHKFGFNNSVKRYFAERYLQKHDVFPYLIKGVEGEYGLGKHKIIDLYNLHTIIRRNCPSVVVEFGCGYSSIAMAHALKQNFEDYGKKGKLYIVEASEKWAANLENKIQPLREFAEICRAIPRMQLIDFQICHVFDKLPNVRPDMIYLDGPDMPEVEGAINGLTMQKMLFPCAADPLLYEWSLYPGFKMIVDGRYNNVEFLRHNLKREYKLTRNFLCDYSVFELVR